MIAGALPRAEALSAKRRWDEYPALARYPFRHDVLREPPFSGLVAFVALLGVVDVLFAAPLA